jgi:SOS-response transcriptional repressor LexA
MKTYRGIVKGNTVILEQEPDVQEGTEVLVLIQASEDEEQAIVRRQKAMLAKGFAMGKLLYKKREELYERGE